MASDPELHLKKKLIKTKNADLKTINMGIIIRMSLPTIMPPLLKKIVKTIDLKHRNSQFFINIEDWIRIGSRSALLSKVGSGYVFLKRGAEALHNRVL